MSAFSYQALDARGKKVKGVLEGDSQRQVRSQLRQRELRPLEVVQVQSESDAPVRSGLFARGLGRRDIALLTRQLATLIESGMPLADAIQAAARQSRRGRTSGILHAVRSRVVEGHTLAYALGEFPAVFDPMYRAMVRAGESAGYLGPVLLRLAEYAENRQYTSQKISMAMLYPLILIGVALSVVTALMSFVVPELVRIFATSGVSLPWLTRALLAISDFMASYGGLLLVALIALGGLFKWALRNPATRRAWHAIRLKIPVFGELSRSIEAARYAGTLSILLGAGVPLLQSLQIAGEVIRNMILAEAVEQVRVRVEQGGSLHKAMEETEQFPPMMVYLIASGEVSGELGTALNRAAETQERDTELALGAMMSLLEPLLVVFMGVVVLLVVLAVLMPIFDLNTLVK